MVSYVIPTTKMLFTPVPGLARAVFSPFLECIVIEVQFGPGGSQF